MAGSLTRASRRSWRPSCGDRGGKGDPRGRRRLLPPGLSFSCEARAPSEPRWLRLPSAAKKLSIAASTARGECVRCYAPRPAPRSLSRRAPGLGQPRSTDKLIRNSSAGVIHPYDLATGKVAELNTGPRRHDNNDHVLSLDGRMLALSNFEGEPPRSVAFVLPVEGSDHPVQPPSPAATGRAVPSKSTTQTGSWGPFSAPREARSHPEASSRDAERGNQ